MTDTQQQPTDQFDPIDALEAEDQITPDEETAEFATVEVEDEALAEQELVKAIDAVIAPLGAQVAPGDGSTTAGDDNDSQDSKTKDKPTPGTAGGEKPVDPNQVKKAPSYMVPRALIDSKLASDDLFDEGML